MRTQLIASAALLLLPACGESDQNATDRIQVTGQSGGGSGVQPARAETRGQDFVSTVVGAFDFAIESARLAERKAGQAEVKQFAAKLRADIETSRTELAQLASASGLKLDPMAGETHQTDLAVLSSTQGAPLEQAFAEQQMEALTGLVGLIRAYKNGGDNPQLKAWAEKHQGTINDRLLDVQTLNAELQEVREAAN
jgi:putative membrane protein